MNYIVEDNIDFFSELKKMNETTQDNDDNVCLITGEKLDYNFVTLSCNHSFNYKPLFCEIKGQKTLFNAQETLKLNLNQIKCPYCRCITNYLLPQIPEIHPGLVKGVNSPKKYCMKHRQCQWVFKSGKNKNQRCGKDAYDCSHGSYCRSHRNLIKRNLLKKNIHSSPSESVQTYNKLTVAALKNLLREKKLKLGGKKNDLINRLKDNIEIS